MPTIRCILVGLGNLGRRFCEIVVQKENLLRSRYGLDLRLVAAADSRGGAALSAGLDWATVAALKQSGQSIAAYPGAGRAGWRAQDLVAEVEADVLLEVAPVNLALGGQPGLDCVRTALRRGMHVITANKAPIVLAYAELQALARAAGRQLRFDGTVAGGLPALYIGERDLRGATIFRIEAVPNLVTGYIMDLLAEGYAWEQALDQARAEGVLEADADWDLDGWDAAAKLVILANVVLGYPAHLQDVQRTGIRVLDSEDLRIARARGYRYRLLARADLTDTQQYVLSVAPVPLSTEHPLGHLGQKQMGVVYHTDIYGTLTAMIEELNPVPSAATLLRDLLAIYVPG